jgi:hypothetical protein
MNWYKIGSHNREAQNENTQNTQTMVQNPNFSFEIEIKEEEKIRLFKILIFGVPGTPIFELGEMLSDYYNQDFYELNRNLTDNYFTDKIQSIYFDTGDKTSGSASQHTTRDPATESRYRAIDRFLNIPNLQTEPLSFEDKMNVYSIRSGIIVSELAEEVLLHWIRNGNGLIFFLDIDEEKAVKWLKNRRKCTTCNTSFHTEDNKPRHAEICDRCGSDLILRREDEPANVRHQFNVWRNDFSSFKKNMKGLNVIEINIDSKKKMQEIVNDCTSRINKKYIN